MRKKRAIALLSVFLFVRGVCPAPAATLDEILLEMRTENVREQAYSQNLDKEKALIRRIERLAPHLLQGDGSDLPVEEPQKSRLIAMLKRHGYFEEKAFREGGFSPQSYEPAAGEEGLPSYRRSYLYQPQVYMHLPQAKPAVAEAPAVRPVRRWNGKLND